MSRGRRLLRDQLRRMREFLRERRRMVFGAATDVAKHGIDKIRNASTSTWTSVKDATGWFRQTP